MSFQRGVSQGGRGSQGNSLALGEMSLGVHLLLRGRRLSTLSALARSGCRAGFLHPPGPSPARGSMHNRGSPTLSLQSRVLHKDGFRRSLLKNLER